jgi:ATP synthase protein I
MLFKPAKTSGEALRAAGALSTVGLAFVLALVMGFWIGDRLDRWFGTAPLLTLVFFFLGLAAGIVNVYRIVSQSYPSGRPAGAPAGGATLPAVSSATATDDVDTPVDEDRDAGS